MYTRRFNRMFKCMKTQNGEDFYKDCATYMVHDNVSNAKTFTKTAKVVNEDVTTMYVPHFVTQVEQSCHARRCHNNLSRIVTQ